MPSDLLSSLLTGDVDLERFALATDVAARRAFVDARLTPGTADHFLLSVLCDQQAGESYAVQRAKLDQWVSMKTKAAGGGRGRGGRPHMGSGFEKLDGRARLQAVLADPDSGKTTPQDRQAALEWLRKELSLSFNHAPPKGKETSSSKTSPSSSAHFAAPADDWWFRAVLKSAGNARWSLRDWEHLSADQIAEIVGVASSQPSSGPGSYRQQRAWDTMVNSLQTCSVPDVVSLIVVPDLKKDVENRRNPATKTAADLRWGFRPVHSMLTIEQRWEVASACPSLLFNREFLKQILVRVDAEGAEGLDLAYDADARLAHIDRLEGRVRMIKNARDSSRADKNNDDEFFINTLLAALAVHRLHVFVQMERQKDAEECVRLLLRNFRWQFSFQREQAKKQHSSAVRRLQPAAFSATAIVSMWPLLSKQPGKLDFRACVTNVLRRAFSDPSCENPGPYLNLVDNSWLDVSALFATVKLQSTSTVSTPEQNAAWIRDIGGDSGLGRLEKKSDLSFCSHNRAYFSRTRDVALDLEAQNVGDRLTVKVFELNTTAFYHAKMCEIDERIDLDGLVPSEISVIELSETQRSPRVISRHRLTFPSTWETPRGVFVIEVIAGGRSARAVVRVGRLRIVTTSFPAGQVVSVFDEQNNAVPTEGLSLWLSGRQYLPQEIQSGAVSTTREAKHGKEEGSAAVRSGASSASVAFPRGAEILIPYAPNNSSTRAILTVKSRSGGTDWSFSTLCMIARESEHFTLDGSMFVDREALIMGNDTATLIMRPRLTINGKTPLTPISRWAKNVRLTVDTTDSKGIQDRQEIPDVKLSDTRETAHAFRVPAGLSATKFTLAMDVISSTTGAKRTLKLTHSPPQPLNAMDADESTFSVHLRAEAKATDTPSTLPEFSVALVGKGGEPVSGVEVRVELKHRRTSDVYSSVGHSDALGLVQLGSLRGFDTATVRCLGQELNCGGGRIFRLPKDRFCTLPSSMVLLPLRVAAETTATSQLQFRLMQGPAAAASASFPVPSVKAVLHRVMSSDNNRSIHDVSDKMRLLDGQDGSLVSISGLKAGTYRLRRMGSADTILTVPRGQLRSVSTEKADMHVFVPTAKEDSLNASMLQRVECSVHRPLAVSNPLHIASATVSSAGEAAGGTLKIVLEGHGCRNKDVRVHVLATHFVPAENHTLAKPLVVPLNPYERGPKRELWQRPLSYYLSNRVLGDEYCYILDRKTRALHARAGVMLERSGLLLNSWDVRKTTTRTQEARSGTSWSSQNRDEMMMMESACGAPPPMARKSAMPASASFRRRANRMDAERFSAQQSYNSDRNMARASSIDVNSTANMLFLPEPSLLLENLSRDDGVDENGTAVFTVSVDKLRGGKAGEGSRCIVSVVCLNRHGQSSAVTVYLPRGKKAQKASIYLDSRLYPHSESLAPLQPRNVNIPPPLDPSKHYVERCATSCVHPGAVVRSDPKMQLPADLTAGDDAPASGGCFVFASSGSGDDFNAFDTLEKVRGLIRSLVSDGGATAKTLDEFSFLWKGGGWAAMSQEDKQSKYSTFACHELNLFIHQKDPDFFSKVVAPYIADKAEPTFMDAILLGRDVSRWKRPAEMIQLNALEAALLVGAKGGIAVGSEEARAFAERLRQRGRGATNTETQKSRFAAALKFGRMDTDTPEIGGSLLREKNHGAPNAAPPPRGGGGGGNATSRSLRGAIKSKSRARLKKKAAKSRRAESSDDDDDEEESEEQFENYSGRSRPKAAEYRAPGKTMEQAESNYWKTLRSKSTENPDGVVPRNEFWGDYASFRARASGSSLFLSENVLSCCSSFTEVMAALSVLDLPLSESKLSASLQDGQVIVRGNAMIVFSKSFCDDSAAAAASFDGDKSILINRQYWDANDWYRTDRDGQRVIKFLTRPQFEPNRCYGCEAVITNLSLSKRDLVVLQQIPQGAVPLSGSEFTTAESISLTAYSSKTLQYHFYFPRIGSFSHFPVTLSSSPSNGGDMEFVASGDASVCSVVLPSEMEIDTSSWDFVSARGSLEDVETFLRSPGTILFGRGALDLSKIAWRMKDPDSYKVLMSLLEEKWIIPEQNNRNSATWKLWSYTVFHGDFSKDRLGRFVQSTAFVRDLARPSLFLPGYNSGNDNSRMQQLWDLADLSEHLEYSPLVNARAHQLGPERKIMNAQLSERYTRFISDLAFSPPRAGALASRLAVVYYWLALDRVTEAMELFHSLPAPAHGGGKGGGGGESKDPNGSDETPECWLQWSYMKCYCLFLSGSDDDLTEAAALASTFEGFPIRHWRRRFAQVVSQVKEARADAGDTEHPDDGAVTAVEEGPGGAQARREKDLSSASRSSPSMQASLEGDGSSGSIVVRHSNMEDSELCVNYFLMDIEFLFSANPFVGGGRASGGGQQKQQHQQFSFVRPNYSKAVLATESVELVGHAGAQSEIIVSPPEEIQGGDNDYIAEVVGKGIRAVVPVFRSRMSVNITETTGRLRATMKGKSAPRCYVKVYSEDKQSRVRFYKDGYTDIRGCFDYVSLDTDQLIGVKRFAILVSSADAGALVKECLPPAAASGAASGLHF